MTPKPTRPGIAESPGDRATLPHKTACTSTKAERQNDDKGPSAKAESASAQSVAKSYEEKAAAKKPVKYKKNPKAPKRFRRCVFRFFLTYH